tara:strand:- start:2868 stop:3521 length:654 start_codon:yes stop_codon:yes gene_type:complete
LTTVTFDFTDFDHSQFNETQPMPKRIFILNGHPAETSLNRALAEAYAAAARTAGHDVRLTHLRDMDFDPDYGFNGYAYSKPLEPDLETLLADIEWAQHVVITTPMWWGGLPAKLKGMFDRALLPGRSFDTRNPKITGMPRPMLLGRTARLVITSDTPRWFLSLSFHGAMIRQLRDHILKFVGITPTRVSYFGGASHPKTGRTDTWLNTVRGLGTAGT